MMKRILLLFIVLMSGITTIACPVCERQQPKLLRGIIHGVGPDSKWDYLIVGTTILIVIATLFYSIKWLLRPGEKSATHIKNTIINQ